VIGVSILGSTGSIGNSALRVIERHPRRFRVVSLAANSSVDVLARQADRWKPRSVVVAREELLPADAGHLGCRWLGGREALLSLAEDPEVDVVINALVGAAGLRATLRVLQAGKRLALANKESLVAGGDLVMRAVHQGAGELVPVDSEHSAILQCIEGYDASAVSRVVLTASGGPFRGMRREELEGVGREEALRHPTWKMGEKVTVDSATLANKALEIIEAHHLFALPYESIEAVVHPQSIVHSFVEFRDGSVLAQLGFPTMELPILYALGYPARIEDQELRTFDPVGSSPLTFEEVDSGVFTLFRLGLDAGRAGGTATAVFNAANEIAVAAFLSGAIDFLGICRVVEEPLNRMRVERVESVEQVLDVDRMAREHAREAVRALGSAPVRRS
jgi:1-deoxy-D-xylulose-5-phosphate reductoisomerase